MRIFYMETEMTLEVNALGKVNSARDKIAEEIAREHIHRFFVKDNVQELVRGNERIIVSLEVINPKANLMKDFRSLFVRTKVKGWISEYRDKLVKLASSILELSSTPDLALILQVIVMRGAFLAHEKCRFEIALVEVKRGKGKLSSYQKKDVEVAKTRGIPYYLLRVDDSDCLNGRLKLKLKPLTPNLQFSVPQLATV
jgi:hypothetical protein